MFYFSLLYCGTRTRLAALAYDNEALFPRCTDSFRSICAAQLHVHSALGDAFL